MGRGINEMVCSCGTITEENAFPETTREEDEKHNCPRGCCLQALQCSSCGIRILIKFEAPEPW